MSVEQLEEQIQKLPREELARLVGWLDGFLGKSSSGANNADLDEAEMEELLRRRHELLADPNLAQPLDDAYFAGVKRDLADARVCKASVR